MRTFYQLLDRRGELILERGELDILMKHWERESGYYGGDQPPRWRWLRAWLLEPEAAWIREAGDITREEWAVEVQVGTPGAHYGTVSWNLAATPRQFLATVLWWKRANTISPLWPAFYEAYLESMPFEFVVTEG